MADDIPARDPRGRLAGKVAMVVGAGASVPGWGIGNATATLFAREGAAVICIDRDLAAAAETCARIAAIGGTAHAIAADAADLGDMQRAAGEAISRFGRIDVLQNNVGGGIPGSIVEMSDDDWTRMIELNLNTTFRSCKAVLPHMIERGRGAITNIASVAAVASVEDTSIAYSAAKAGVVQLTRATASQLMGTGVRMNAIIVGHVDTAEIRRRLSVRYGAGRLDELIGIRARSTRAGRIGSPWDIAHAALYLGSDEAGFVTGHELVVDGGTTIAHLPSYRAMIPE